MKDTIKNYIRGNEFAIAVTSMIVIAVGLGLWLEHNTPETATPDLVLHCTCEPL